MSGPTCEIEGASVVLIGHFNPALVHPSWLVRHGLVREREEAAATVDLVRPELSLFTVGPFRIEARPERFVASVEDMGNLSPLRDLVSGVFSILSHTPITKFGLNRLMHFKMASTDSWHRVGHALAPKDPWDGLLEAPGTLSLTVQGTWPKTRSQRVQAVVQPTQRFQHGVFVAVTAHFEVEGDDASTVLGTMQSDWDSCFAHARKLADSIVALGDLEVAQ